jgi:hypothetical protein
LNGSWRLDSSEYVPSYLPSYCNNLYLGSKLIFREDGLLDVIPKDSTYSCFSYGYRIFDQEINLAEYDMILKLEISKLTADSLILRSYYLNYVDKPLSFSQSEDVRLNGYKIYLTRIK